LGDKSFEIEVSDQARQLLLERGSSPQYGARELKRTIHRMLTQPLAALVASGRIAPGTRVMADADQNADPELLSITPIDTPAAALAERKTAPTVLILDDHAPLLEWLDTVLSAASMTTLRASTAAQARELVASRNPDAALLDVILSDGDGVSLALEFRKT